MKTAIALLAAALSVAALSSNASAQRLTANIGGAAGPKVTSSSVAERNGMNGFAPKDTGVVGFNPQPQPPGKSNSTALSMGTNYGDLMTGGVNNVDYDIGSSAVLVKTYCSGYCVHDDQGADTSFGTRSGGGFKLASNKAELGTGAIGIIHPDYVPIDPEVPGEAMAYRLIASLIEVTPGRPDTISVVAPTGETQGFNLATATEYDLIAALIGGTADPGGEGTYTTTTGEADAAKTFNYCVIYPERCTVSEIERPTFGPHILTFDD